MNGPERVRILPRSTKLRTCLRSGHDDDVEVAPEEEPVEAVAAPTPEPVNRGLLLKFLGSARN